MLFEIIPWLIPVLLLIPKRMKKKQIFFFTTVGIFTFIFYFVKKPQLHFYYISGIAFLLISGFVRYSVDKKFDLSCLKYSKIIENINVEILKIRLGISQLQKNISELEKEISTYEMLYSISKILVKNINLDEIIKDIKSVVFSLRPYVQSFEIYAFENLPKKGSKLEVPILLGDERLGVIQTAIDKKNYSFSHNFLEECEVISNQVALALKRSKLYQLVIERSRIDGLTGLYLRRYFLERLKQEFVSSRRYGTFFSLLMIDIDHFKNINDTYGHLTGDKVLSELSEIFKSVFHPGIIISRYGGEEFAVIVGITPQEEVRQMAEKLRKTVEKSIFPEGIHLTISIGIAYRHQAESEDEILRKADEALYRAKNEGRNRVIEYS